MDTQEQTTPTHMRLIGIGAMAAGLYGMLVGLDVLPVPGGRSNLHGPLWLALLIGLVVFLAGLAALLQAVGRATAAGDMPADAPLWMRAGQYAIAVAMFAGFAVIGSWVAVASDPRYFSAGIPFFGSLNIPIARIAFGFGALICWLGTIAYAVVGARKLFGRGQP